MGDVRGDEQRYGLCLTVQRDGWADTVQAVMPPFKDHQLTRDKLVEIGQFLKPFVAETHHGLTITVGDDMIGKLSAYWDHSTDDVLVYLQRVRSMFRTSIHNETSRHDGRWQQAMTVLTAALLVSCPSLGYLLDLGAAQLRWLNTAEKMLVLEWVHPCDERSEPPRPQSAAESTWEFLHETSSQTLPNPAPPR